MTEPRFIDANKIDFRRRCLSDEDGNLYVDMTDVKKAIAQTPTEDVVKVVRCKDCEHSQELIKWNRTKYVGCNLCMDIVEVAPMHYCSYGEIK